MKPPLVSIITVNYNTAAVTGAMLQSLSLLQYPNIEVIVVDNASTNDSSAYLKNDYSFIKHISAPVNLGFAGGNNIGLQAATGDYIFFLNNDTEVTPDLVTNLVDYMQGHPTCAMACPKIKYHYHPDKIQYAGTVGLHPLTSRSYNIGFNEVDKGQYNDTRKTDQPNGAAMMVPARLIREVGPMTELFFLYYEELDWAAQFKKHGYEVHYVGTAEVYHKESVSTGINSAFKTYYLYRNRLLYIRRNYNGVRFFIAAAFFVFVSTPVHIIRHALRGEWAHSKAIWRGLWWNIKNDADKEPDVDAASLANRLTYD